MRTYSTYIYMCLNNTYQNRLYIGSTVHSSLIFNRNICPCSEDGGCSNSREVNINQEEIREQRPR